MDDNEFAKFMQQNWKSGTSSYSEPTTPSRRQQLTYDEDSSTDEDDQIVPSQSASGSSSRQSRPDAVPFAPPAAAGSTNAEFTRPLAVTTYTVRVDGESHPWIHSLYMIAVQSGYSEGFDLFQKGVREIQGTPTATPANASLSLIRDVWKRFGKHDFYLVVSTPGHPFFQWHLIQDNSYLYQRVARKLTGGIALDTLGILTDGRLSPARLSSIDDFATVRANESTLSAAAIVARGGGSANRRQVLDFPSEWLQPESSFAFCRIRFQEIGKKVDAEEEPDDEFGRAYTNKMAQLTIDE